MNKRDAVLRILDGKQSQPYVPAAFFLHFAPEFREGQASVQKHLEYFRYTGMDFVKIQYEQTFPTVSAIQKPGDWSKMPAYGHDFFAGQLAAVRGLVDALKREAVVIVTLYSTYMCAGHSTSDALLTAHLNQDPDAVRKGFEIITDSLLYFVRECIKIGVDGFYTSTQGGEAGRFADKRIFDQYIRPFDLTLMEEANRACQFNVLHVCDYQRDYDDFTPFLNYPGQVLNCPLHVGSRTLSPKDAATMFNRPYMGGLERKGILATGTAAQIQQEATDILKKAPEQFILGADCTVPAETPWANLKVAIDTAHNYRHGA